MEHKFLKPVQVLVFLPSGKTLVHGRESGDELVEVTPSPDGRSITVRWRRRAGNLIHMTHYGSVSFRVEFEETVES